MKTTNYKKQMIRHGEMLLVPVDAVPADCEQIYEGREFIVARSETHHHHVAVGDVTVFRPVGGDATDIYLRANKPSVIEHRKSHDKHETKTIHEGVYLCRPKSEYDPFAKLIQKVRD